MIDFVRERWGQILFASWQHLSLVVQCLVLATVIAVALAALCYRRRGLISLANNVTAVGLTIPSFALIGLLVIPLNFGVLPAVVVITFYAVLPILRNAVVGLSGVSPTLLESAKGMGMGSTARFLRVQLPMAWPVIMAGLRVSAQMSMGVAAIAAYALGPGLGPYIFTGLAQIGGANALNYALVGTLGVVVLALLLDAALLLVSRLTTSKGIRA